MSTDANRVVYVDRSTDYGDPELVDVITAGPAVHGSSGTSRASIAVVRRTQFKDSPISNDGDSLTVCIEPGQETKVLAALGNVLRGNHPLDAEAAKTVITDTGELGLLRSLIANGDKTGTALRMIDDLVAAAEAVVDRPLLDKFDW